MSPPHPPPTHTCTNTWFHVPRSIFLSVRCQPRKSRKSWKSFFFFPAIFSPITFHHVRFQYSAFLIGNSAKLFRKLWTLGRKDYGQTIYFWFPNLCENKIEQQPDWVSATSTFTEQCGTRTFDLEWTRGSWCENTLGMLLKGANIRSCWIVRAHDEKPDTKKNLLLAPFRTGVMSNYPQPLRKLEDM